MPMLSRQEIESIGFAAVGKNALISDRASFYGAARIALGDNVRIDDFCVLSAGEGGICIGQNVHIAVFSSLIGDGEIAISDFAGLSSRVSIYSSSDDFSGATMTNPTVPRAYTGVVHSDVFLGRHVIVGSGSIILPGAMLHDGVAVGALSLVNRSCDAFGVYAGNPVQWLRHRRRDLLEFEKRFLSEQDARG